MRLQLSVGCRRWRRPSRSRLQLLLLLMMIMMMAICLVVVSLASLHWPIQQDSLPASLLRCRNFCWRSLYSGRWRCIWTISAFKIGKLRVIFTARLVFIERCKLMSWPGVVFYPNSWMNRDDSRGCNVGLSYTVFLARDVIYTSRLCYDVSVRLSVRHSVCDGSALAHYS